MDLLDKIYAKIKWLRTQPESVKVRHIWAAAIIVLLVIVALWAGIFRKYERKSAGSGKNLELINAGEKIKNDLENKIKMPDINLPKNEITPSPEPEKAK